MKSVGGFAPAAAWAIALCIALPACGATSSAVHDPAPAATGLSADPNALSMGPTDLASVNVVDPGYTGSYSAQSSNTGVATVRSNGPAQFVIIGVAPGTCTITVADSAGHNASVSVSIQTTVIGGQ